MGKPVTMMWTVAGVAALAAAGAVAVVFGGLYDVSATGPHTQPVHAMLETAMQRSVRLRARGIQAPALADEALVRRGAACFRAKCVQCHGAPGVAPADFGQAMQPLPGPLVDAAARWQPHELYWLVRHGIKMSGMPAWDGRLPEQDLWAVVAFLGRLPDLTPQAYAAMDAAGAPRCDAAHAPAATQSGDARRGQAALRRYACHACHTVPGVTSSSPHVGPPLAGIARRTMIGGRLANTPGNMVRWLTAPHEVDPETAMPAMGVTPQDARDIAAFLATLE